MLYLTFFLFIISILIYIVSFVHYKSFLNPMGVFSIIWGSIPFMYTLRLSSILMPLSTGTYLALFTSFFAFIFGCVLLTKKEYKSMYCILHQSNFNATKRTMFFYWLFFIISIAEMFIKTPPLFSANPYGTYLAGVGVRFLHFANILIAIPYYIIFLDKNKSGLLKSLLFFPPVLFPLIHMQRGLALNFLVGLLFLYLSRKKIKKQFLYIGISMFLLLQLLTIVGEFRQSFNTENSSISDFSGMNSELPKSFVWFYTYTVPSVQNLDQTINNPEVIHTYGAGIIEPIVSILQLKFLIPEPKLYFSVINGFNVPTYLYWCYINFGFLGFFIVPFILGVLSQKFYNESNSNNKVKIFIYALWLPNIFFSFHDFLFWNTGILLIFIISYLTVFRIKISLNKKFIKI